MIEQQDGKLAVTPLGQVAARSGVSIDTFGVLAALANEESTEKLPKEDIFSQIMDVSEMRHLRPFSASQRVELLAGWVGGQSVAELARDYSTDYAVGHGRIRDLGEVAAWLLSTAASIAAATSMPESTVKRLGDLANEAHFGLPAELVRLAQLRVLHRSDLLRLVNNAKGIKLTEPHEILDADPGVFVGILSPQKATALKESIARSIGETLRRREVGHLMRCDRLASLRPLVVRVYEARGTEFERALEDLLNAPMVELGVRRFTRQRTGQADLELVTKEGTIVVGATASEDNQKPVSWDKCRQVLGSVGYTGIASNFVVVGKPDFHATAIDNAKELGAKGQRLLLVPVDVLVELCLQRVEQRISQGELVSRLNNATGYTKREDVENSA